MMFLIIISLHGGIDRVPLSDLKTCQNAARVINNNISQHAVAYCIETIPKRASE